MNTLDSSIDGLTDNWLLQSCAEILEGTDNSNDLAHWAIVENQKLKWFETCADAIRVESLCALIEQIVFCDKLIVMSGWTNTWEDKSPQLQTLLGCQLVKEFDPSDDEASALSKHYLTQLCTVPAVAQEHELADAAWQRNEPIYSGQFIAGSTGYLAQSNLNNYSYTPHPVRARFLRSAMYRDENLYSNSRYVLNFWVDKSRTKLVNRIGPASSVTTLICRLSSIALLCLRESKTTLPLITALQLRDSDEFRRLRQTLHEMQLAIAREDEVGVKKYNKLVHLLEKAISEVERSLKSRALGDQDGIAEISVYKSLPVKIPSWMRVPLIAPRHTTAMYRLVATAQLDLREVLKSSLGIDNPRVVQDLIEFSQDHGHPIDPRGEF